MKVQFQILLFMCCLNLGALLVFNLGLAGTEYLEGSSPIEIDEYETHFNASEISASWGAVHLYGIPVIGDIFSGFQFLFRNLQYLLDGFPMFLNWISDSFIVDAQAKTSFNVIMLALRGMFAITMSMFVIEFISGRYMTE